MTDEQQQEKPQLLSDDEQIDSTSSPKDHNINEIEDENRNQDDVSKKKTLFHYIVKYPYIFTIFWPVLFIVLISFGWTYNTDELIEERITEVWQNEKGKYANDVHYGRSFGSNHYGVTSFAAMAVSRDNGNLFNEDRLEEIRTRMEQTERITLTYKDVTYTWEDICLTHGGYTYEFPCARLSPMDLFQETRWFFNYTGIDSISDDPYVPAPKQDLYRRTWYKSIIQDLLIRPRIPRFQVLLHQCGDNECANVLYYRLNSTSKGYNPLALFADIGNLPMSDVCRICIETSYEKSIRDLYNSFKPNMMSLAEKVTDDDDDDGETKSKILQLAETVSIDDVEDFYFYYNSRQVYATLGADFYLDFFKDLQGPIKLCQDFETLVALLGVTCPSTDDITREEAERALFRHADAEFSSVTTAGAPFPFWSEEDGTGSLFKGTSPVGGSGVNMSANITSIEEYLSTLDDDEMANVTSIEWIDMVEKNPLYAWFMANLTYAPEGTACGNGYLTGTDLGDTGFLEDIDKNTSALTQGASQFWCTKYSIPNTNNPGEPPYTKQHFARMWYDLLIMSKSFLNIQEGVQDPYVWTLGQGCGYDLASKRDPYTNTSEETILQKASRPLYYIDEGDSIGAVSSEMLIGDAIPVPGEYSFDNPLQHVGVIQTIYAAMRPRGIMDRVQNCKRPGGPVDLSEEDAREVLYQWKEKMEEAWTAGWDDEDAGEVQFLAYFDDAGAIGTAGRMMKEITLDSSTLTIISVILIALFSVIFLVDRNPIESRVFITLVGVTLVVLAFFAALGFSLLLGIKISASIAWTLPFIILGLGVDDMYIVLQSLRKQDGYSERNFLMAMKEVMIPVTMTSLVNASMFAILNISAVPAIYLTAQAALYCIIFLYCAIIFCFPAFCYLDMKRQAAQRKDLSFCKQSITISPRPSASRDFRSIWLYDKFYEPLILGEARTRKKSLVCTWVVMIALIGVSIYGLTQRSVGLGLEDFFPYSSQASAWARTRTRTLASWPLGIAWGALNYTDPDVQMKMIKQFEDVVANDHVAEMDTKFLWMASFLSWTTRHCSKNFGRKNFEELKCGHDMVFSSGQDDADSVCSGTWKPNYLGLRGKNGEGDDDDSDGTCKPFSGGICRLGASLHPDDWTEFGIDPVLNKSNSYCPTVEGWSDEKWQYCLLKWRNATGFGDSRFILETEKGTPKECSGEFYKDQNFVWPIPMTTSPNMWAFDLFTHEDTVEMLEETKAICEDHPELHCWMTGIPIEFYQQYLNIFETLLTLSGLAALTGIIISFGFLFGKIYSEERHSTKNIFLGCLVGALLIGLTIVLSLITVIGLSMLANVNLTGFSNMAFVLSVGFAVEYSVHIIARWLRADLSIQSAVDRVKYTMSFLMLPTFMSFVSSTIGVVCLAFNKFEFNKIFFFRPLIIVMFVTYFFGCWWLPATLTLIDSNIVKLGKKSSTNKSAIETFNDNSVKEQDVNTKSAVAPLDIELSCTHDDGNESPNEVSPSHSVATVPEEEKATLSASVISKPPQKQVSEFKKHDPARMSL